MLDYPITLNQILDVVAVSTANRDAHTIIGGITLQLLHYALLLLLSPLLQLQLLHISLPEIRQKLVILIN